MLKRTIRRALVPYMPGLDRVKLVQMVINKLSAKTYLEIGVDQGRLYEIVHGPLKIGVDPVLPAPKVAKLLDEKNLYVQKTSDDFFREDAPKILGNRKIDVAFIDGLHEYKQVLKDIENTLHYLSDNGVIILHDCNPWSRAAAIPAFSMPEAKERALALNYSEWDGGWTGDVWKSVVTLRSRELPLEIFVLDADCGLGVIRKRKEKKRDISITAPENMEYADLEKNKISYLNLKPASYYKDFLKLL